MSRILVYYFAFPHYRMEILTELQERAGEDVTLAGGTVGRENVEPLTRSEIPNLLELPTITIGPFSWQRGIFRRAVSREFDSVVLGPATSSLTTWAILFLRRLLGRKVFLWGRCGRPGERNPKRYLQEIMNRVATGLLVYGESEGDAAAELGLNRDKVQVVYNATRSNIDFLGEDLGLRSYDQMKSNAENAINRGEVTIVYVGRLVADKMVDILLEAASSSRKRYKNLKVIIVGGGPELENLQEHYSGDYIEYLGWIYDADELNAVIGKASLIVSPNTIGLLAVDALRVGIPVLYPVQQFNGPEVEALTPGVNALTFVAGDSSAISKAIDQWFAQVPKIDRDVYLHHRDVALRAWSPENVAERILTAIGYKR